MSLSASLYSISETTFKTLQISTEHTFKLPYYNGFATFEGSMDGLEYVICKGLGKEKSEIVSEIFIPRQVLGSVSDEYFQELVESGNYKEIDRITSNTVAYLPPEKLKSLFDILSGIDEQLITQNFNPDELNRLGIYPSVWHHDNSPDKMFNLNHIKEEFTKLKNLINLAHKDGDYILTFVG